MPPIGVDTAISDSIVPAAISFVINALLFWAAASVLDGFYVAGFWAALLGSIIYSVIMLVVDAALRSLRLG